jgi:hypothetical protein
MPARGCVMPAKGCVIAIRLMPRHWRGLPAPASRCGDQLLANSRGNGLVHPFRIHSAHDLVFAVLDVLAPDGYLRRTLRRYSAPVSDVGCANLSPQPVSRIATAISSRPAGSSLSVPAQAPFTSFLLLAPTAAPVTPGNSDILERHSYRPAVGGVARRCRRRSPHTPPAHVECEYTNQAPGVTRRNQLC